MRQGRPADADSRCGQAVRLHEGRRARGAASTARLQLATLLFVRGAADEAAALCRAALAVARTSALAGGDRQQARAPKGPHALARQRVRTHGSGRKPSSRAPASVLACGAGGPAQAAAGARSGRPPMQADRGRHASRAPRHASPLWALGSIVTSCADASSREGHAMGSCPRASIVCAIGAHASGMASRHHRPHGARAQVALCEHRLGTIAAAAAVVPGEQLGGAAVAAALAEAGGAGGDGGRADAGAGASAAEAALQRAWEYWERTLGPDSALTAEARWPASLMLRTA